MEWISVKDPLPPEGWCIATYRYFADPKILQVDFCLYSNSEWRSCGYLIKRDVTHWMLLPEPAKESE